MLSTIKSLFLNSSTNPKDQKYMRIALSLAQRSIGVTAPNPSVGCVIVNDGQVVGRGVTAPGGRPHAETQALKKAGEKAKGATVYVTLEPCSHHGKTPPCVNSLIEAGVKRVVIATGDPHPYVSGQGIKKLKKASIEVVQGVLEDEARRINEGFFSSVERKRPFVTLKLATTADGKIAPSGGKKISITNQKSKNFSHMLRYYNDAIMIGVRTLIIDDSRLNCRISGLEDYSPVRVVMDSSLCTPLETNIIKTSKEIPTWIITLRNSSERDFPEEVRMLQVKQGVEGKVDVENALSKLSEEGVNRLLVEGGSVLASSLLKHDLVDRFILIEAPMIMGEDGLDAVNGLEFDELKNLPSFSKTATRSLDEDTISIYDYMFN